MSSWFSNIFQLQPKKSKSGRSSLRKTWGKLKTSIYWTPLLTFPLEDCPFLWRPISQLKFKTQKHKNAKTQNIVCNAQIINAIWFVQFCVPLEKGQNGVFWEADFGCLLMADRSFFVTISQSTPFVLFLSRGRFASPQHRCNFNERVSLIIPLLFSLQALVFDFDRRTKEHIWVWPILLWSLCTCVWSLFYFGFWLFYMSCWTCFSISLRAYIYSLYSVRSWTKFRMTWCLDSEWRLGGFDLCIV